jgi:RNA polymerase sigma-70 factor (ECF subfamily)
VFTTKDEMDGGKVTPRAKCHYREGYLVLCCRALLGGVHVPATATDDEFAQTWQANRLYLVNLAYGMLGDIGAAEDAVQEAFARFSTADRASIDDARGWLIVVTSRICLDQIGSARVRRERAVDASTIEFTHSASRTPDPADRVTLDDEVRSALLVVLERLTPAERVVFVLHDIFQTPFDNIATTVGRPVATCRQLARRARLKIARDNGPIPRDVNATQHRLVVDQFIDAVTGGNIDALVPLLDPDVWRDADMGALDPRSGVVNHGFRKVSRNLMRWFGGSATLVSDPFGDQTSVRAFVDRRLYAVIYLTVRDGLIQRLHVIADPESSNR